ncbi:MAG: prolipoprotein diacylglyceryl transferase [Dehalococcoidales bacterium]|nr:prolipoprotein diacylglyceryl transferase [Dehalococcoidales bacterium]
MLTINIDPVLFTIGSLSVRWYGLMYTVGIIAGLLIAWPYAMSKGIESAKLEKVVLFAVPAGLIGARLYYVVQQPLEQFINNPWRIVAVWEGGMAFFGAIFAVVITIMVLSRHMQVPVWKIMDTAVIFATAGQFFGRIGNIINGDVIGSQTDLPWGIIYAHPNSFAPRHDIAYHPAAIYEAIINVILFSLLWGIRNRVKPGILFFIYIFGYSLSQVIVFFWRDNEIVALGLKQAQVTSLAVMAAGAVFFFFYIRSNRVKN